MAKGSCLCGKIQFEVLAVQSQMAHCHCSMCRKFHGAAFSTFGVARRENFRWQSGEALLCSYTAPNGTTRKFCKQCGSSLIFADAKNDGTCIEFALGALDDELDQQPDAHIYVGNKASWYKIGDHLPCFQEDREK